MGSFKVIEGKKQLPLRLTVRVLILKGDKICLGKILKNGSLLCYTFPGGGVEFTDSAVDTVIKESLEEIGVLVHRVKPLNVTLQAYHEMNKPGRSEQWGGTDTHYFTAEYLKEDHSELGADGDTMLYDWVTPANAIALINAGPESEFNYLRVEALTALMNHHLSN